MAEKTLLTGKEPERTVDINFGEAFINNLQRTVSNVLASLIDGWNQCWIGPLGGS